jgi:hypothetical protein
MDKQYLGDSVYVEHDGYGLTLTTESGMGPSNTIYLEPVVYKSLQDYVAWLKRKYEAQANREKSDG